MSQYSYTLPVVTPEPPPPVLPLSRPVGRYTPGFQRTQKAWLSQVDNPWRKFGVVALYPFFFLRFTDLNLIIAAKTGFPNYLLYFAAVPAVLGLLASDGVRRAFRLKSSWYFLGFMILMAFAAVFSSWPGGSILYTFMYFRATWICFVLLAGLIMTWSELWGMAQLIALCAATNVLIGVFMAKLVEQSGRYGVELGTNSNPNDFAAVLILILPFLALVLCTPKRNIAVRLVALAFLLWGFYHVLASGSRGALLGMVIASLYLIAKLPGRLKIAAILACVLAAAIMVPALPRGIVERITSWEGGSDKSAVESAELRKELLLRSLRYTVQHPLLGVGPAQFGTYEGKRNPGQIGSWYNTHNSYTQISSENGIPAAICYLLALGYSFMLIRRVYQRTKRRKPSTKLKRLHRLALCLLVAMVGFCVTIAFNNFGYLFFVPALVGLAVVLTEVTEREFQIPLGANYRSHPDRESMSALA